MNRYLLDRDVMSQLDQSENDRHENVRAWFKQVPDNALFVSAITVMEAWKGFARQRRRLADDSRQLRECAIYEKSFGQLVEAFSDRVMPIDEAVAKLWGEMLGQQEKHTFDAGVAATAIIFDLIIATRNTKDFVGRGARTINPFNKKPRLIVGYGVTVKS